MLDKSIQILNFDNSIIKQKNLISKFDHQIIDLTDLGPSVRLWMDKKTHKAVNNRLADLRGNGVRFIGSGDFHNVSSILARRISKPFSLIVFDFHPDWDIFPPRFGCGSWITESLKYKNIVKVVLIGVSSDDISTGGIQSGNLKSLRNNRLEIYPYQHNATSVFFRKIPENKSISVKRYFLSGKINWNQLREVNISEFMTSLLRDLPTGDVYISIDKDCLMKEYAVTNWEEGFLSLEQLLCMLRLIKEKKDIVGVDITGDYSEINIKGKVKSFFSRLDHPKDCPQKHFSPIDATSINESTNLKILEVLFS
ncbi:MAG: arginase family protein [Candidatus Omnitrophica bacterium]|nr:arginase family protein [Candidatus Omnitrophota bacterium]